MRVLIVGAGRAGLSVAHHLRDIGHDVTIIDRDEAVARRAFEKLGLVALVGDATDAALLRDAEIGRTDVVVAMLRRDADNLAVALLARAGGARQVIVRMRDGDYRPVYEAAGVHRILSEIDVMIGALGTAIEHDAVRNAMVLGSGESVAFEMKLPEDSGLHEKTVSDVAADPAFPPSCVFAGIVDRGGIFSAPRGGSVVLAGSTLFLVCKRAELASVVRFFMQSGAEQMTPAPPSREPAPVSE